MAKNERIEDSGLPKPSQALIDLDWEMRNSNVYVDGLKHQIVGNEWGGRFGPSRVEEYQPMNFNYMRQACLTIERGYKLSQSGHKFIWSKWKRKRKLVRDARVKIRRPQPKAHREHADAAYRNDEYDIGLLRRGI